MAEPTDDAAKHSQPSAEPTQPTTRVLRSLDLLQGERQVFIEHDGVMYRLQLTRNGRLILQK